MKNVYDFFYLFARFEFALKALGFHKGDGDAQPSWDRFAKVLSERFNFDDPHVKKAVDYYFSNPPKKQIIKNGELDWKTVPPNQGKLKDLFLYLRRVRNNLFHGGKFRGKYFEYPERSNRLIDNGIIILNYCSNIYPDIKEVINK